VIKRWNTIYSFVVKCIVARRVRKDGRICHGCQSRQRGSNNRSQSNLTITLFR